MKRNRPTRNQLRLNCAEIHPDDGQDPKEYFRGFTHRKSSQRKALQLCRQVADTLSLVLSGDTADEVLRNLDVVAVEPAPDSSQLLVLLGPAIGNTNPPEAVLVAERLHSVGGRLRSEVATAITRRRAPKLLFRYLPGSGRER